MSTAAPKAPGQTVPPGLAKTVLAASSFSSAEVALVAGAVVLILLSAVFALSETAITRTSRVKATAMVEEGRRGSVSLLRLVEHAERNIPVILFALQICTLVAATIIGVVANEVVGPLGVVVATAFEIVVIFVFAELAPKSGRSNTPSGPRFW